MLRSTTAMRKVAQASTIAQYLVSKSKSAAFPQRDLDALTKGGITNLRQWKLLQADEKKKLALSPALVSFLDEGSSSSSGSAVRRLAILYASQTGTAETYAKTLSINAMSHGLDTTVMSMNDAVATFSDSAVDFDAVIFLCSTYGTGELPSNGTAFWKALCDGRLTALNTLPHAVFGLGNSNNEHFNQAAKNLSAKLKSLGSPSIQRAELSCELQENGHDGAFRNWKKSLWTTLGVGASQSRVLRETYTVVECLTARPDTHVHHAGFLPAVVHQNAIMTPKDYTPRCRLLRINVDCELQRRGPLGRVATITDHIQIYPHNEEQLVTRMLKRCGLSGDAVVEVTPLAGATKHPYDHKKLRVRTLLAEIVDLSGIPSRSVLETMSLFAGSTEDREKLEAIANDLTVGGQFDRLTSGVFTVVDAFEMFPSVTMNLAQILTVLPHIAPRSYSIAADNTEGNHASFDILYNIPTRQGGASVHPHTGACTGMLDRAEPGDKLAVAFVPSNIALPRDDVPAVIVALGTGIGSAHSILQHRFSLVKKGVRVGKTHLFYGMRHLTKDNFFAEDFAQMEAAGFLTVTRVASHDGPQFVTPMDKLDASIKDFLGDQGHISYCGLGGSVPLLLENALRRCGVNVSALRKEGRYHEEYFTVDLDSENLFKNRTASQNASTLAGRMGSCEMFCFQCEQTFKGRGCHKVGVCGKTPRVAALQDLTIHGLKYLGYYAHQIRALGGSVSDEVNRFSLYALFSTLTNVNFDESRFVTIVRTLQEHIASTKAAYLELCKSIGASPAEPTTISSPLPADTRQLSADALVDLGRNVSVLQRFTDPATQSAAGVSEMVVYGIKGIAAYADHSLMNKKELPEIYAFVHKALAFMTSPEQYDLGKCVEIALEAGKINVATMGLLYESNASLGVPTVAAAPVKPVKGKAILVSGHDLIILKSLLEKTEPLGINVYTHGEMLPAHAYPKLKAHKNLVGHFGGAWMRQSVEFPHFPGPVLMTTNCLTEPHESYSARIFTAGAVGWSGVPHIGNTMSDIKFDALIEAAQAAPGFGNEAEFAYADPVGVRRPAQLTVGFGHETVLSVAPTIIEEIKKGNITRFFVVGGCDGYEGQRSYYTDLVARLPKTAVVLTVGCGKFRFNYMDLGTIGNTGIPRILDMGQCNDSFSAVQVALALAKVLNCQVSDLPLSIVLSWFEQKAIAVLLSCLSLGLKPIHVGPALPAFITPDVLQVLVENFGIRALGNVDEDLKKMLAATGAS